MKRRFSNSIKKAYQRDCLTSSLVLASVMDILIGGFAARNTLIAFGLLLLLGAIAWRWLQLQPRAHVSSSSFRSSGYLSADSSQTPLPLLTSRKKFGS